MRIILMILVLLLIFSGCGVQDNTALTYSDGAFECELSWSVGETMLRGVMLCGARVDGGDRELTLRISEPSALCGAVVKRSDGVVSVSLGGVEFKDIDMSGLLRIEKVLDCRGEVIESTPVTLGGGRVRRVVLRSDMGDTREVYVDCENGYPIEIHGEDIRVKVIYFIER
jgi:hypothetical protein